MSLPSGASDPPETKFADTGDYTAKQISQNTHSVNVTLEQEHPKTRDGLRELIVNMPADQFANYHLLDRVPWLFQTRHSYISWKTELAKNLQVDPFAIVIVGSAALGFSLSPGKDLASFHDNSDIDIAIISTNHFESSWTWLRNLGPVDRLAPGSAEAGMLKQHRRNLVFDGAIATDKIITRLPFGVEWTKAFIEAANREPTVGRQIKGRIYRDYESLRQYQVHNLVNLKNQILSDI
ncbi:hypothetical protein [Amycolatopsis sp. CA-230715]|uniref:hypothetical protein n=1 Tax=Amycolatopsis sp. CA-230715 TaxID=2745196 RepID=UPI001C014D9C|nr:hypothetical protein [Amycolatopsis sp. CA-230715]